MKCSDFIFCLALVAAEGDVSAQSPLNRFLTPSDTFNKGRALVIAGSWTGIYTGALVSLNHWWYADYSKTPFHFFNDGKEWLQMDKAGHVYTAYFESVWTTQALKWSGTQDKKAAWLGAATGFAFQTTIEVFDGFSEKWGASPGDILTNVLGSSLSVSQFLLWNEQRVLLKFSAHPVNYPSDLEARADDLVGGSLTEKILKDYNGQTYWMSLNVSSFIRKEESKFPKWLNIAAGYSVDGLYGGYENIWEENGEVINRSDISRMREFYLSPDIDFTRIKTHSPVMKTCFSLLNILKIPAPALNIDSEGKLGFHPLYF